MPAGCRSRGVEGKPRRLANASPKRFWSGQITTPEIIEKCRRYQPELLVLPVAAVHGEWLGLLEADYDFACADKKNGLYVAKRIKNQ